MNSLRSLLSASIPQPSDPDLIEAAHAAAAISWRTVPYYRDRYGERGWQFTLADSGWMTTLPACGPAQTTKQIRWVARLLSNRGMPGWLTEQHIRVLTHQLNRRLPEQADQWKLLDDARESLAALRRDALPDAELEAGAQAFAARVGEPGSRIALGSGRILLSAAADQRSGIRGAVRSVLPWFTDPDRFSPEWRRAARALVREDDLHLA